MQYWQLGFRELDVNRFEILKLNNEDRVFHVIVGLGDGGAEGVLSRLCSKANSVSHHVVSLTDEGKYGDIIRKLGVPVTCLNMPQGRVTLKGLWRLWRLLYKERPTVVQTWMYHADFLGGVIARLAGVEKIFWNIRHTTLDADDSKRSTIFVARLCARISHWVPTAIVCCAEKAVEVHRELGYASKKLMVIPNGYDLRRFFVDDSARVRLHVEWGVDQGWLLGMVGRFNPQKDHKNFLSALAELKCRGVDFYAVLIGRELDESNQQVLSWLNQMGLEGNVRLLGQRTDIADVMNALDVHVLSSSFGEAFPNVLAEAMACGTPVVTTDVGDAALIVGDTGWVVPPQNHLALADALLAAHKAISHPEEWGARRAAARQRIEENFSLAHMVASYEALWRSGRL